MAKPSWEGRTLGGRYQIGELLGHGGMSSVYKAFDPNLKRDVAIKIIHSHLSDQPDFVERFEREAASVAQLRHPNIIQVHDFSHEDNVYYIVFEYIAGENLQDRLKRLSAAKQYMPIPEVKKIMVSLANALDYAHGKGIIHRDIKPANVMLNHDNEPILMDFGITKIIGGGKQTATGITLGTVQYMSPEQIKGLPVDARTDIYALGITLYEMLGGRSPFEGNSTMAVMMMHVQSPVPDPRAIRHNIPPVFVDILNKAMAKESSDRYQRALDLARDMRWTQDEMTPLGATIVDYSGYSSVSDGDATLVDFDYPPGASSRPASTEVMVDNQPQIPPRPYPAPPTAQKKKPSPWLWAGLVVVLLAVVAGGVWFFALRGPGVADRVAEAEALAAAGQYDEAIAAYEGILGEAPGEETAVAGLDAAILARAQAAINQGNDEEAEADLSRLLAGKPNDATLNMLMADLLVRQERFADALPYYDAALAQDDKLVEAYLGAGRAAYELDNYNRALEYFSEAVTIAPGNAEAYAGQGKSYYALGWYDEAISPLEKWASLDQQAAEPFQWLSSIYEESDDLQKRLETASQWVERDPQSSEAHSALGWAYYGLERFEEASAAFSQAIVQDNTLPAAYRGLGHVHYAAGEYEAAIENYNKWLEYEPDNPSARNSLGWSYFNSEQYTAAQDAFLVAFTLNPNSSGANQGLGYVYEEQGDYANAVTYYRNWANLSSNQVQPYNRLGWALFELAEYTEAIAAFGQIIQLDSANASGYKGLAYAYKQLQNEAKTYEYQLRWVEVAASDPEAHTQLGWTLYGRQDFAGAARSFSRALALNSEYYSALSGRGQAYFYAAEYGCAQAVPDFEAALRLRPADTRIAELLARCEE